MIFLARGSGLANRLRALVGYVAAARLLRREFALCWVRDVYCDAEFADLFDTPAFPLITLAEGQARHRAGEAVMTDVATWFYDIRTAWLPQVCEGTFLEAVGVALRELRPSLALADAAEAFARANDISTRIGIHIRHTDNVDLFATRSRGFQAKTSTVDGFLAFMHAQIGRTPLFLATDNSAVERLCREELGSALMVYPKVFTAEWQPSPGLSTPESRNRPRTTAVQDAVIELLLLGRCRQIVGTYYSSFSKFAAVWGTADYLEIRGQEVVRNQVLDAALAGLRAPTEVR